MVQPLRIARTEDAAADAEARFDFEDKRLRVLLGATIQSGANQFPVRVRAVSSIAALVDSAVLPPVGSVIRFSRGEVCVSARVTWAGVSSFEMEFREAIDERALFIDVDGSRARGARPPLKAIFPPEDFLGCKGEDDRGLPISKH